MQKNDIPASVLNAAFVEKIQQGFTKEAAVSATSYVRDKLREGSFLPKIMTEQPITADQLDKDEDLDQLKKIYEIEPDSEATWVTFKGMPNARYLQQEAGVVYFGVIVTDKVVKNIFELKTRDNDVRKILSDNHVKDILAQQDGRFIDTCRNIVTGKPAQDRVFAGGLTKVNFVEATKILPTFQLPNGVCLMNEATSKEILKWDANDIGDMTVIEHYKKGLTEGTLMGGLRYLTTIKNDIVQDNEVWFFTTEDFMGKFFTLQDSTVFIKSEGLFIEFYAYKCLGIGLRDTHSIVRCVFNP